MYSYPQYIYPPTTVPVQRYFADPHVQMNSYAWGGFDNLNPELSRPAQVNVNGGQWMDIGDKIDVGVGKVLGKVGIKTGGSPVTGLSTGILGMAGDGLYNVLGGRNKTGVGNTLNAASKFVNMIPGVGKFAGLALNGIGALVNRGWGSHRDATKINAFNADTSALNNTRVSDSSNESIANQAAAQDWGGYFTQDDMGETGWFNKNKFRDEFNDMMRARISGQNYMAANYDNAATNVQKNMMNNLLMNSAAYGGYFDNPFSHPGSGAIAYGLEQQNLANQQQFLGQMQAQQNQQMPFSGGGNTFACGGKKYCLGGKFFADGGNMNSHGSDFTNGLVYIENGGTHEENPYQGVPMGYDRQGVPNVVEEGEIVIPRRLLGGDSDYVLSNRIPITEEFAAKYHLSQDLSIAQAAEKLTKESRENPNDIIIERTNTKLMRELRDMQEQIKQEMQAQQQQRQIAEQQYAQAMGIPQQAMSVPEEQEALNMQAMQEEAMQQTPEIQQPMMAFGGNLFGRGGYFGPVNCHAIDGELFRYPETVENRPAGNQYPSSKQDSWDTLMSNRILKWVKDNITSNQSESERLKALERLNALQDAYYEAGMIDDDLSTTRHSEAIKRLQKIANDMGINDVFDDIDLYNYFDNHKGQHGDVPPTYFDGENGGMNGIRTAGYSGLVHPEVINYLRGMGVNFMSDPSRGGMYYAEPFVQSSGDEYMWDENSNYTGPELKPGQYLTESELNEAAKDINKKNGVVTGQDQRDLLPTWQRMMPLWASGLGVLTDALGITNRPDYSDAASLEALASKQRGYMPVSYKPIGERISPVLFDPYQAMIASDASAAALRRAIQDNSNGNTAMANASMIAADRNAALARGQLAQQGQLFNAQNLERALGFNRETDAQNSQGILNADTQNPHNWRLGQGAYASLFGQALGLRQAERQAAAAAHAANLSNFVKGMSNYGKENAYINMVNTNAANQGYGYGDRRFGIDYRSPFFQIPD